MKKLISLLLTLMLLFSLCACGEPAASGSAPADGGDATAVSEPETPAEPDAAAEPDELDLLAEAVERTSVKNILETIGSARLSSTQISDGYTSASDLTFWEENGVLCCISSLTNPMDTGSSAKVYYCDSGELTMYCDYYFLEEDGERIDMADGGYILVDCPETIAESAGVARAFANGEDYSLFALSDDETVDSCTGEGTAVVYEASASVDGQPDAVWHGTYTVDSATGLVLRAEFVMETDGKIAYTESIEIAPITELPDVEAHKQNCADYTVIDYSKPLFFDITRDYANGGEVGLYDLKDAKLVLLTSITPSEYATDLYAKLQKLYDAYADKGLKIIAAFPYSVPGTEEFLAEMNPSFYVPQIWSGLSNFIHSDFYASAVFFDGDGNCLSGIMDYAIYNTPDDISGGELVEFIESHLG